MAPPNKSPVFTVLRRQPVLITPSSPTPHEFKLLSDIDDQESFRFNAPVVWLYRHNSSVIGKDPVKVIREALAKTLVFYYPFAGRLRELPNRKLVVECNGEGIMFIEADADATLDQFGDSLQPPFPCFEELLFDVPGSAGIVNCPLLLVQVTRLKCGGFIFAIRLNHTMSDAFGLTNFVSAVAEMAEGASLPSVLPVWERHLLSARDPPRVTCTHKAFEPNSDSNLTILATDDFVHGSFFFGQAEISRLREQVPSNLPYSTTFELLTACIWKCRTVALQYNPSEETRMICLVNIRNVKGSLLPKGYYGNGFAVSAAVATAGDVVNKPFSYLIALVKKAKADVTIEHMKSLADLMELRGRPHYTRAGSFCVSNLVHRGFENLDFGWGKAVYGGPASGSFGGVPRFTTLYLPVKNKKGEEGIVIPMSLPKQAMRRFEMELENMSGAHNGGNRYSNHIVSAL